MSANLAQIFKRLREEQELSNCAVCRAVAGMDDETKESFIDVMKSSVTIKAITSALASEGISVTRFQLGESRRECVNGHKECRTFKGVSK
jgi:hypothetical protein